MENDDHNYALHRAEALVEEVMKLGPTLAKYVQACINQRLYQRPKENK